jgi:hypothetical protein
MKLPNGDHAHRRHSETQIGAANVYDSAILSISIWSTKAEPLESEALGLCESVKLGHYPDFRPGLASHSLGQQGN